MAFLTILTRTYKRPLALAACVASVEAQTCRDYQHVFIVDDVGVGIAETYRLMSVRDWSDVTGEYVYLLDDDNVLTFPGTVAVIKQAAETLPALIIARANMGDLGILPPRIGVTPLRGYIDLGCVVMRRDLFTQAAKQFGHKYDGDYDYIQAGIYYADSVVWLNQVIMKVQRRSLGVPE